MNFLRHSNFLFASPLPSSKQPSNLQHHPANIPAASSILPSSARINGTPYSKQPHIGILTSYNIPATCDQYSRILTSYTYHPCSFSIIYPVSSHPLIPHSIDPALHRITSYRQHIQHPPPNLTSLYLTVPSNKHPNSLRPALSHPHILHPVESYSLPSYYSIQHPVEPASP